ncbi:MAG: helix-turn-helix transcriptional regulator [Bosea sp.]|jgi:transcriptional regulator with XRE-family HTH domain|nr:helix-turn-helix transcriptional regulator [Bosea sp. (in: a-proteobacteria)]
MRTKQPVDVFVGSRMRMRRLLNGLTQKELAEKIGTSFQQLQKYEKGMSRIGPARLQLVAQALEVPISFFFEGSDDATQADAEGEAPAAAFVHRMVAMSDGQQLARAFISIGDSKVRRQITDLVESMAQLHRAARAAEA